MKSSFALTAILGLITPALADFYLYAGVTVDDSGEPQSPETYIVDPGNRGNCDGIDTAPQGDAAGEWSYPWPEAEFSSKDNVCGIALKFTKNGDDYNVYDSVTNAQVGTCTAGTGEVKACFWGLLSAEYQEDYFCQSEVCA